MALQFLTEMDLKSGIIDKFINERSEENPMEILQSIEAQNIALIKTKIGGRYNTNEIFNATDIDRHWLIIKILIKLVLYDFVRRNAARKVPEDYSKDWEWAMRMLEKIKGGTERPDGLPTATDSNGNSSISPIWANNRNEDYYI